MRALRLCVQRVRFQSTVTSTTTIVNNSTGKTNISNVILEAPEAIDPSRNRSFNNIKFPPQLGYYKDPLQSHYVPELEKTRLIPKLKAFYSRNPFHEEHIDKLMRLLNKNATLPFDRKSNSEVVWIKFNEYKEKAGGDSLKETEYLELIKILKRLDSINVELRSEELNLILKEYSRSDSALKDTRREKTLDDKGRAIAIGRRKSSSAKVYLVKGNGQVLVNGQSLEEVFPKLQDRLKLLYPMELIGEEGEYNVFGLVRGGGASGQIDALKLAISKALCIHNPLFKQKLSGAGCLHRDPRRVERKKPGKKKARKMPTWVKR